MSDPSGLVLGELAKGCGVTAVELAYRTGLSQAVVIETLCELEEQGLAVPRSWTLGPEAEAARV